MVIGSHGAGPSSQSSAESHKAKTRGETDDDSIGQEGETLIYTQAVFKVKQGYL